MRKTLQKRSHAVTVRCHQKFVETFIQQKMYPILFTFLCDPHQKRLLYQNTGRIVWIAQNDHIQII